MICYFFIFLFAYPTSVEFHLVHFIVFLKFVHFPLLKRSRFGIILFFFIAHACFHSLLHSLYIHRIHGRTTNPIRVGARLYHSRSYIARLFIFIFGKPKKGKSGCYFWCQKCIYITAEKAFPIERSLLSQF